MNDLYATGKWNDEDVAELLNDELCNYPNPDGDESIMMHFPPSVLPYLKKVGVE